MHPHPEASKRGPSTPLGREDLDSPYFGIHIDIKINGDILISRNGSEYYIVTIQQLEQELQRIQVEARYIVYSREEPYKEPPAELNEVIAAIKSCPAPAKLIGFPPDPNILIRARQRGLP